VHWLGVVRTVASVLVGCLVVITVLAGSTSASAATTVTTSCVDGAGRVWRTRVVWGGTYLDAAGVRRVAVSVAGWTTNASRMPTDSTVRTYGPNGALVKTLVKTATFDTKRHVLGSAQSPESA